MNLNAQAQLVDDNGLIQRVAAAAALCGLMEDTRLWATNHMWQLSAQPGWSEAYAEASKDDPEVEPAAWYGIHGKNPNVITDQMVIDGVIAVIAAEREHVSGN